MPNVPHTYEMHGVALRRVFPGIPKCLHGWAMPARLCASLFNPWAFMIGPVYTLYKGLWGKSVLWLLLAQGLDLVPDVNDTAPLAWLLTQSYALQLYGLANAHGLFVADYPMLFMYALYIMFFGGMLLWTALLMAGHWLCAIAIAVGGTVAVFEAMVLLPPLDLGISNAIPWLVAREVWPGVAALALYAALAGLYPALVAVGLAACVLYTLGLPVQQLDVPAFLYYISFVLIGMMTNFDVYRHRTLKQSFWW